MFDIWRQYGIHSPKNYVGCMPWCVPLVNSRKQYTPLCVACFTWYSLPPLFLFYLQLVRRLPGNSSQQPTPNENHPATVSPSHKPTTNAAKDLLPILS